MRHQPGTNEVRWNPTRGELDIDVLRDCDAVINLAGAGIGDKRWTSAYKATILESRTSTTSTLAAALAELASDGRQRRFLNASAIGFYGSRNDETLDESSDAGSGFLADVCTSWEAATTPAEAAGVPTVHLRTGIVLTPKGGALKKLLPLFRLGVGGRMASGKQWQSWISLDDEINAILHLLTSTITGAVNLTAPNPVTNAEFTKILAKAVRRPALVPVPAFGPRLLLGRELADALLMTGQRVLPQRLLADGFTFVHENLDEALSDILSH